MDKSEIIQQNKDLRNNVKELKKKIRDVSKNKEFWFNKKEELKQIIKEKIQGITSAKTTTDKNNVGIQELKKKRDKYNKEVKNLISEIKTLNKEKQKFLDKNQIKGNPSKIAKEIDDLEKQVENLKMFGVPIVIAINKFDTDSQKELKVIMRRAEALEVNGIAINDVYKNGGKGGEELARVVAKAIDKKTKLRFLYPTDLTIMNKIERVAKSMYGASEVKYSDEAVASIARIEKARLADLPVCMAKTHLSLSNNPVKKGRPRGFKLGIEEVKVAAGAGYIVVKCEGMNVMPGLPKKPRGVSMDIDVKTGAIKGLL